MMDKDQLSKLANYVEVLNQVNQTSVGGAATNSAYKDWYEPNAAKASQGFHSQGMMGYQPWQSGCPSCGYCSHCGRGGHYTYTGPTTTQVIPCTTGNAYL